MYLSGGGGGGGGGGGLFPALVFFHFCGVQALLSDSDDVLMSGTY